MLDIQPTKKFLQDLKRIKKRGYDLNLLEKPINTLAAGKTLPKEYKDHKLSGNLEGCRECHITSDWILVYKTAEKSLILYLMRTGTHADILRK